MNPTTNHQRRTRLQRECNVSTFSGLLLFAACAVLLLVLAVNALQEGTTAEQAGEPTQQTASSTADIDRP